MADYTVSSTQQASYEIALAAGVPVVVQFVPREDQVTVAVHSGTAPVYAKATASALAPKDPNATVIPATEYATVSTDGSGNVSIVSAAAAVVSVWR